MIFIKFIMKNEVFKFSRKNANYSFLIEFINIIINIAFNSLSSVVFMIYEFKGVVITRFSRLIEEA